MKGLVFAGCSFTWGQGLYYYSDLNHIPKFEDWTYDYSLMTHASIKYKDTIRFPRLVANHFNTFEVCKVSNGGSDLTSLKFLDKIFNKYELKINDGGHLLACQWLSQEDYYYDDIEYVIFQTTQPYRSRFRFTYKDKEYFVYPKPHMNDAQYVSCISEKGEEVPVEGGIDTIFFNWLNENNYSINDYLDIHVSYWFNEIKDYLTKLEKNGIKIKVLLWTNEYFELMKNDSFFKSKLIKLEYDGIEYKTIQDLQISNNEKFTIAYDVDGFNGKKPEESKNDYHPSKLCNEVIAKSIINEIEKRNKKPLI